MRSLILVVAMLGLTRAQAQNGWLRFLHPQLQTLESEVTAGKEELAALGSPVVGQTVPEFGYQLKQMAVPPPESPWLQLDLGEITRIDHIVLVPALVDFQSLERRSYGFPRRFRVDLSDDEDFDTFTPALVHTDEDFPDPMAAPVVIALQGRKARFIRVTVTRLAEENGTYFFALAEVIALKGNRNIALGAKVKALNSTELPPRWSRENLVDGRTPLGPPIRRDLLPYDGLFAQVSDMHPQAWMMVDLGKSSLMEELRLHPVHARLGADVPGFNFPLQFQIQAAETEDFANPLTLFDSAGTDFPNPGNNPVTIVLQEPRKGRYVRIMMVKRGAGREGTFGLSEVEIRANGRNIANGCAVTSSGDRKDRDQPRPESLLTDGYTSYGRLLELSNWMEDWRRRAAITAKINRLETAIVEAEKVARNRGFWLLGSLVVGTTSFGTLLSIRARRGRRREQAAFRDRIAQDLHDEIGSNLAGIAVISEMAADQMGTGREDWREVNRIARESNDAMREVLWLVGARQESGIDLMEHLHLAAKRLLTGCEVEWTRGEPPPAMAWNIESRREVFLFFKEALTNIVHHARARRVKIHAGARDGIFELAIEDDGSGFEMKDSPRGMGLKSLRDRASRLKGHMTIASQPGTGTKIVLRVPVST
jgi:signal transduction histidine kinase